jgi:voltage-gated potassium channel
VRERIRFLRIILILLAIIVTGTVGYILIEGWSFIDALYMTIITISTVGYSEVHTLSNAGRLFSSILIVIGVGAVLYTFTTIIDYFLRGHLRNISLGGIRIMEDKISKLRNHYIICDYGRVGAVISDRFKTEGVDSVVVDSDSQAIIRAKADGYLCIEGDPAVANNLIKAGIKKARCLLVVTDNDAENVLIIVTARNITNNIHIIARASSRESESKLEMVGADKAMNPYSSVGERMARRAIHPVVSDFLEDILPGRGKERYLESVDIAKESIICGKKITQAEKYSRGAVILAIRKKGSSILPKPSEDTIIERRDRLVILGTEDQLSRMEHIVESD